MRTLRILMMCIAWLGLTVPAIAETPSFVSCAKLAREAKTVNLCVRATTQNTADEIANQIPESTRVGLDGMPQSIGPADAYSCNDAQTVCAYVAGESRMLRENALKEVLAIGARIPETIEIEATRNEASTTTAPTALDTMAALQKMEADIQKVKKDTERANRRAEAAEAARKKAEREAIAAEGIANAKAIENDGLKTANKAVTAELSEATLAIKSIEEQNRRLEEQNRRLERLFSQAAMGLGVGALLLLTMGVGIALMMKKWKRIVRSISAVETAMEKIAETLEEARANGSADSNEIRDDIQGLIPRLHGMMAAQLSPLTLSIEELRKRLKEVEANTAPLSLPPLPPLAVVEAKPLQKDPDLEEGLPYLVEPPQGGSNGNGNGYDPEGTLDLRNVSTLVGGA